MNRMCRYAGKRKQRHDIKEVLQFVRFAILILFFMVMVVCVLRETEQAKGSIADTVNYEVSEKEEQQVVVMSVSYHCETVEKEEQQEDVKTVRYELTDYERDLVERVVMSEASGEGFDGQRLVAQCILNTAEFYGIRPDEVVLQPNQYASPSDTTSEEVKEAVSAVFDDGDFYTEEPIRWFYAKKWVTSEWHESKCFVLEYGGHRFFKEW